MADGRTFDQQVEINGLLNDADELDAIRGRHGLFRRACVWDSVCVLRNRGVTHDADELAAIGARHDLTRKAIVRDSARTLRHRAKMLEVEWPV